MADSLRGNGLYDVHDALARLAANTGLLDRALRRFGGDNDDEPPPPYYPPSTPSGTTTQPDSPEAAPADDPESVAERRRDRQVQVGLLHERSLPHEQFGAQSWALALRLAMARRSAKHPQLALPVPSTELDSSLVYSELPKAEDIIRARWKEQSIWSDRWNLEPPFAARWQHEEDDRDEATLRNPPRRRTRAAEAAAATAASRPYPQFMYQVAKERDLLLGLVSDLDPPPLPERPGYLHRARRGDNEPVLSDESERAADEAYEQRRLRSLIPPRPRPIKKAPVDIHTTAYESVRSAWERWKIWDPRWTTLPGMQWMHEEPLDVFIARRMAQEDGEEYVEQEDDDDDDEEEGIEELEPEPERVDGYQEQQQQWPASRGHIFEQYENRGSLFDSSPAIHGAHRHNIFGAPPAAADGFGGSNGLPSADAPHASRFFGFFGASLPRSSQPAVAPQHDNHSRLFSALEDDVPHEPSAGAAQPSLQPSEEVVRGPPSPPTLPRQRIRPRGRRRGRAQPGPRRAPPASSPPPIPPPHQDDAAADGPSGLRRRPKRTHAEEEAHHDIGNTNAAADTGPLPSQRITRRQVAAAALAQQGETSRSPPATRALGAAGRSNDNADNEDNAAVIPVPERTRTQRTRQTRAGRGTDQPAAKRRRAR